MPKSENGTEYSIEDKYTTEEFAELSEETREELKENYPELVPEEDMEEGEEKDPNVGGGEEDSLSGIKTKDGRDVGSIVAEKVNKVKEEFEAKLAELTDSNRGHSGAPGGGVNDPEFWKKQAGKIKLQKYNETTETVETDPEGLRDFAALVLNLSQEVHSIEKQVEAKQSGAVDKALKGLNPKERKIIEGDVKSYIKRHSSSGSITEETIEDAIAAARGRNTHKMMELAAENLDGKGRKVTRKVEGTHTGYDGGGAPHGGQQAGGGGLSRPTKDQVRRANEANRPVASIMKIDAKLASKRRDREKESKR